MQKLEKLVIVGGGTAGWICAAALARRFENQLDIRLVESDAIGTIGVGEATIPQIRLLNQVLGLDENEFMKQTMATIKLGIEFCNWGEKGEKYIHTFGDTGLNLGGLNFHHYWLRMNQEGHQSDLWDYCVNAKAAYAGKFDRLDRLGQTPMLGPSHAFHFDAGLYAKFLRNYAEQRGVIRHEGMVQDIVLNGESGDIEKIILQSGEALHGDLFIDCTGFRALLLGQKLGVGYQDWSAMLPCDRAIAIPCARADGPLLPYTRSTAHSAGWQWRIPLQHRTGNGHVYCSEFMSDDEALDVLLSNLDGESLAEPNKIRFTTGRRETFWEKNCIAIGLASGFLEPLESTSIHLIQSNIGKLIEHFPQGGISPALRAEYNRQVIEEFEYIRDFIILHYHVTQRSGDPFWDYCREMTVPDSLRHKIDLFAEAGRFYRSADDLFRPASWLHVMMGQGLFPKTYHPMADDIETTQLDETFDNIKTIINREVDRMATHEAFIAANCAGT